jgi:hypothetical protein
VFFPRWSVFSGECVETVYWEIGSGEIVKSGTILDVMLRANYCLTQRPLLTAVLVACAQLPIQLILIWPTIDDSFTDHER